MKFENKRQSPEALSEISKEIRRDIIKSLVIAKSGHSGGPLGSSDIFATLYMGGVMNYDPLNPESVSYTHLTLPTSDLV